MKQRIPLLVFGALTLAAAFAANAGVSVGVNVNPYGYNPYGYGRYAPPVVYQSDPYYTAAPVIYFGGGSWGGGHGRRSRGHDDHRRSDHGDRRH
jgi:hypothetical protein